MGPYCAGVVGQRGSGERVGAPAGPSAPARGGWPGDACLLVLSGGSSRRLGRDKATTHVGGRTLLDRLMSQVPAHVPVVLVGPEVPGLPGRVTVVREHPPGSGPLAAIRAGLEASHTPLVGVLAADMPFAVDLVGHALAELARPAARAPVPEDPATGAADAVVPIDASGRRQPLCAAYRAGPLRAVLADLEPLAGRPVRDMLALLGVMEWPARAADLADVDTPEDLGHARIRAQEEGTEMDHWLAAVREALGLEVDLDVDSVLDVARDAAHNVERPAAPLTTYLLGAAVARGADPAAAAATVSRLAGEWAARSQ